MTQTANASHPELPKLLIVGCGYLGMRVGKQAASKGWSVAATTRHRRAEIAAAGFLPVQFDWNDSRDLRQIARVIEQESIDRVLISVSYDRNSKVDRFASQVDGFSRLLRVIDEASVRSQNGASKGPGNRGLDVCYISTTGVYHQTGGVWVDERSPTFPTRAGGRAHLRAESRMAACLPNSSWTTLRLSGIYGPGRVPRAADVRAGKPIASPPDGHLNLIHVEDAASAVIAAFARKGTAGGSDGGGSRERLYVVSDDSPVIRRQFYEEIADQTGSPSPVFVDPAEDSGVRFRSETDKRIWNRRFKRDLVAKLRFPTYVEGLRSIL
ncbi:MAG: NAD-dependent epimerase/dehydratase family protein [Rhodopirellula sp. JB044]|uniref:NAD-dependent epimerase/dehydratase family protein n=1 Tax=Rhodopirellula sp. JB044 TaxID=3342844 RepID=UPI00370BD477